MPFTPIETQEQLDAIIGERVRRAVPSDYEELKATAARVKSAESAAAKVAKDNQTAMDEVLDRLTKADERAEASEKAAAAAAFAVKKSAIQAAHGVSAEDAELFLTGADEATLTKQAKALGERASSSRKNGNFVPKEGTQSDAPSSAMSEFTSQLFGRGA